MEFVATPGGCREVGDRLEQPLHLDPDSTNDHGAADGCGRVGDDAVAPTANLVPEEPGTAEPRKTHGSPTHHSSLELSAPPRGGAFPKTS